MLISGSKNQVYLQAMSRVNKVKGLALTDEWVGFVRIMAPGMTTGKVNLTGGAGDCGRSNYQDQA